MVGIGSGQQATLTLGTAEAEREDEQEDEGPLTGRGGGITDEDGDPARDDDMGDTDEEDGDRDTTLGELARADRLENGTLTDDALTEDGEALETLLADGEERSDEVTLAALDGSSDAGELAFGDDTDGNDTEGELTADGDAIRDERADDGLAGGEGEILGNGAGPAVQHASDTASKGSPRYEPTSRAM